MQAAAAEERVRAVLDPQGRLFSASLQLSDESAATALAEFLQVCGLWQGAQIGSEVQCSAVQCSVPAFCLVASSFLDSEFHGLGASA